MDGVHDPFDLAADDTDHVDGAIVSTPEAITTPPNTMPLDGSEGGANEDTISSTTCPPL